MWAEINMPRPGEDRSDVGGADQFSNIGPVPLSSAISYFAHNRSITPPRRGILAENCASCPSRSC